MESYTRQQSKWRSYYLQLHLSSIFCDSTSKAIYFALFCTEHVQTGSTLDKEVVLKGALLCW